MTKLFLYPIFILFSLNVFAQTKFESKTKIYSFDMPDEYSNQASNHVRNEFVFVNKSDTTSLVVNVNDRNYDKNGLISFKKATNADVEKNYFNVLTNPQIINRGDLNTYKDKTIYFHVRHKANSSIENDFMLTYIFYNKGKEINFIFRTKERRLDKVLPAIEKIVNSVILLD
jgi:signal peptidase I